MELKTESNEPSLENPNRSTNINSPVKKISHQNLNQNIVLKTFFKFWNHNTVLIIPVPLCRTNTKIQNFLRKNHFRMERIF